MGDPAFCKLRPVVLQEGDMFRYIRAGIRYADLLPREPILLHLYAESRIQSYLDYAKYVLPPLLAFFVFASYLFRGSSLMAAYIIAAAALIMTLLMCYVFLGLRALTPLNERQVKLYHILCDENGRAGVRDPVRLDLALEMQFSLKNGRRDFLDLL